jgi:hypothetical protein
METQHARPFSRRRFLGGLTLAGTAGLLGLPARPVAAEPPPETTRLRLAQPIAGVRRRSTWPRNYSGPRGSQRSSIPR